LVNVLSTIIWTRIEILTLAGSANWTIRRGMKAWIAMVVLALAACGEQEADEVDLGPRPALRDAEVAPAQEVAINPRILRRFKPLAPVADDLDAIDRARIAVGKQLFFDPRLSKHGDVACVTCHPFERGGTDGLAVSKGDAGRTGTRNAPTVFNAARHFAQFWDGRVAHLEEQAGKPFLEKTEMGMIDESAVVAAIAAIPGYRVALGDAFPEDANPVTFAHITDVIAAYETTLITPSRWDQYLRGDVSALTAQEVEGVKLFADTGCIQCHTGELVGGSMFQKVGVAVPWPNQADPGRYSITKQEVDRMVFKVPTLRNVADTAPYFHDGSVSDLSEAVRRMGEHQLGVDLPADEVAHIVAWLKTLSGKPPASAIEPPTLPPQP
jgi:cytochrome c peroxidase